MTHQTTPDPPEPPRSAPPPEHASPSERTDEVLSRLAKLVAERAQRVAHGEAPSSTRTWLGLLKQAVDALEHHVDALQLLRDAETAGPGSPTAGTGSPVQASRGHLDPIQPRDQPEVEAAGSPAPLTNLPSETDSTGGERLPRGASPRRAIRTVDSTRDYPPFRDQTTGLHSRIGFDAVAGGELKRCRRYGRLFSLLLFRLPGTDVEGLGRAAQALLAATRESDLPGRHLDRTLAVALPETPPTDARIVAERVIQHLEGVGVWDEASRLGLVTHPAHGETLVQLLEAAREQFPRPPNQVLAWADREGWPG